MTQQDFESILSDDTKEVSADITWNQDPDHSESREFRVDVESDTGHPMFLNGWYNPLSGKLSYSLIHRSMGRIYGLDLGADHRNPDGVRVGDKHKHRWKDGSRDKWAYVPSDITESWNKPVEVWEQFCSEARLRHLGTMSQPQVQGRLAL